MLVKIIKCLLLTILICAAMVMLAMFVEFLMNTLSAAVAMLIFFSIVVFGTVFGLVWTTLFWWNI